MRAGIGLENLPMIIQTVPTMTALESKIFASSRHRISRENSFNAHVQIPTIANICVMPLAE